MDFNEMKSNWQATKSSNYSDERLKKMTQIKYHPVLNKIRIKLVIESAAIVLFLIFFYTTLDAKSKPAWTVYLLVLTGLGYVFTGLLNLNLLTAKYRSSTVVSSLRNLKSKMRVLSFFSIITSFIFGTALILFFTIDISFTTQKYILMTGIILTFLVSIYLSYQLWRSRINKIGNHINELTG